MNKKITKAIALTLGTAFSVSYAMTLASCGKEKGSKKDSIVLMTEALSGLFNPFYATSGTDMDVVGMTQIGMLTTDENGKTTCGENESTVVLDYSVEYPTTTHPENSIYTFVIKNNLKYSNGTPLTINDVLFNMYEYLDPVYTGSSTMYSTDIVGLKTYRTQANTGDEDGESSIAKNAISNADSRVQTLFDVYEATNEEKTPGATSYNVTVAEMENAIKAWADFSIYKNAVETTAEQDKYSSEEAATAAYQKMLLEDYKNLCEKFKKELNEDYEAAKDSFDVKSDTSVYKKWADKFANEQFAFFVYEGLITPKYDIDPVTHMTDRTNIKEFESDGLQDTNNTKEKAIEYAFKSYMHSKLVNVLYGTASGNQLREEFTAKAKEVLLHENRTEESGLEYPNVSGIVAVGQSEVPEVRVEGISYDATEIQMNGKTYKVARELNADGTVKNNDEYSVLQIAVNGTDPKAIFNFGFSVAPVSVYSNKKVDIKNNQFGVEWGSYTFQSKVIQSVEVPVGAGAFMATNSKNEDNPKVGEFWSSNIVYYKKNENFMFDVKADKLRFQVVSSTNALDALRSGSVDYITPQLKDSIVKELQGMKGVEYMAGWQLGYGYIGINANYVKNIYLRRAIMAAMQTELASEYYTAGTCEPIAWPMSKVSSYYPTSSATGGGRSYLLWNETNKTTYASTISKIKALMEEAGVGEGDSQLKLKFTIAGASITEHPTYEVFKQAATILNMCGWDVEVSADSQALVKLSTGSLAVWAAAWGSTIDPDMYQVYSPYSTATSVKAWGYPAILNDTTTYSEEYGILFGDGDKYEGEVTVNGEATAFAGLSDLIDLGRETAVEAERKVIYTKAMEFVLDLAVEMPVYQRQTLYAYNSKTLGGIEDCLIKEGKDAGLVNPYSSPLGRIWELYLK